MGLPRPPQLSTDPQVNASAMQWANLFADALEGGGGPWHIVGDAGEPAFQNAWVNFDTIRKARFYKDPFGIVHLGGIVKTGTVATVIFTLPAGYAPLSYVSGASGLLFPVVSNGLFGACDVRTNGDVIASAGSNVYFTLDGISFRAI